MVETALCISVVLLAILGVMQCSLALYTDHFVEAAAVDAARYAMVRGSTFRGTDCSSPATYSCEALDTEVTAYARSRATPGIVASKLTVATTWPKLSAAGDACASLNGSDSPGCIVIVSVTYPFSFLLPAPSATTVSLHATASRTITQ